MRILLLFLTVSSDPVGNVLLISVEQCLDEHWQQVVTLTLQYLQQFFRPVIFRLFSLSTTVEHTLRDWFLSQNVQPCI